MKIWTFFFYCISNIFYRDIPSATVVRLHFSSTDSNRLYPWNIPRAVFLPTAGCQFSCTDHDQPALDRCDRSWDGRRLWERRRNYFWESTLLYFYSKRGLLVQGYLIKWCYKAPNKGKMKRFCLADVPPPLWVSCWKKCQNQPLQFWQCPKERVFCWDSFPKLSKGMWRFEG